MEVAHIAEVVAEEMKLSDVEFKFAGGVDGGRGWVTDVKNMLLDTIKLKSSGGNQGKTGRVCKARNQTDSLEKRLGRRPCSHPAHSLRTPRMLSS